MNLLLDQWVPVRLPDGTLTKLAPGQIPESGALCVAHPRADFSALITELLVCIFQTLSAPKDESEQRDLLSGWSLPDVSGWSDHNVAFEMFGAGARFMQGPATDDVRFLDAANLLFEFPAASTQEKNKDFFQSRDGAAPLCPHCAPVALFLNQSHARMGGTGYRTGPRENSVMTALLRGSTLWKTICLNLLPLTWFDNLSDASDDGIAGSFPWLFPAKYFETKAPVALSSVGKFGALWWSPVDLRLTLEANPGLKACFTCGNVHEQMVFTTTKCATASYLVGATRHPHTGFFTTKKTSTLRACEVPAAGFTFEHWQALTVGVLGNDSLPAWQQLSWHNAEGVQLWVFGYCMGSMSPIYWLDELAPVLVAAEGQSAAEVQDIALRLLGQAQLAVKALSASLYYDPKKYSSEIPIPRLHMSRDSATQLLWQRLSPVAMQALRAANVAGGPAASEFTDFTLRARAQALLVFDQAVDDCLDQPKVARASMARRAKLAKSLLPKSKPASK